MKSHYKKGKKEEEPDEDTQKKIFVILSMNLNMFSKKEIWKWLKNKKQKNGQAGAELGQAQPKLGLNFN